MSGTKQSISPRKALQLLDDVRKKFQGTWDDHLLLNGSMDLLRAIVSDWERLKQKEQDEESKEPKEPSAGEGSKDPDEEEEVSEPSSVVPLKTSIKKKYKGKSKK